MIDRTGRMLREYRRQHRENPMMTAMTALSIVRPSKTLHELRGEIRAERISMNEIIELQGLADSIEPGDVELAEWAGIPEDEFNERGTA